MNFPVFLVATLAAVASGFPTDGTKIIDGEPAQRGQFPWQVCIYITQHSSLYLCGGTLVSDRFVVSAAHCFENPSAIKVLLGVTKRTEQQEGAVVLDVDGDAVTKHPQYGEQTTHHDIAVVRLPRSVEFNNYVSPAALPPRGQSVEPGIKLVVSGWGRTRAGSAPEDLQFADVQAISNEECAKFYGDVVAETTLCTNGHAQRGACSGDSGGPLVLLGGSGAATLAGVVSFGSTTCLDGPSAYTRVEKELDFLEGVMGSAEAAQQ